MYSVMQSASVYGVEGKRISVEVDIASGLPQVSVVGLPDPAVRESIERVRAALKNSGFAFPLDRITVNLAPADLRKEGTAFDLAIAAGILAASGQLNESGMADCLLIGELSLNGALRPVPGVLAMLEQAKAVGIERIVLPLGNAGEASLISGLELYALEHLRELADVSGEGGWSARRYERGERPSGSSHGVSGHAGADLDYDDVIGQQHAKRAMLVAAAGRHNVLLSGPPGTGKTMMIRRLPSILPPLSESEALEVTKIYSVAGKLSEGPPGLMTSPPFRAPHHTISSGGLIGGGSIPKPGEVTLAHHGVLFLDELPEFPRAVLEALRQPIEDLIVTVSRSKANFQFPAAFMLAASYNPCPCGYYGHEYGEKRCSCSASAIARYRAKLSGPLLDRIDLQLEVARPIALDSKQSGASAGTGAGSNPQLSSARMRERVLEARAFRDWRLSARGLSGQQPLTGAALRRMINVRSEALQLLESAFQSLGISMRAYDRMLKLARTIADIELSEAVEESHVAEAIGYRKME